MNILKDTAQNVSVVPQGGTERLGDKKTLQAEFQAEFFQNDITLSPTKPWQEFRAFWNSKSMSGNNLKSSADGTGDSSTWKALEPKNGRGGVVGGG